MSAGKWKNAIKNGREATLCRDVFLKSPKEVPGGSLIERIKWNQVVFATLVLYLAICFVTGCYAILDLKVQENVLLRTQIETQIAQKKMEEDVEKMKTKEAIEARAREQLGLAKPGEILVTQKDKNSG